jgi:signal transduction histidine kinase
VFDVGVDRVRAAHVQDSANAARRYASAQKGQTRTVSRHDLPEAAAVAAGIIAVVSVAAFALHWAPHWTDTSLRASIETIIALAILLAASVAIVEFRRRAEIEPLVLLGALVAVGVVNLVSWAPQLIGDTAPVTLGIDAHLLLLALVPLMVVIAAAADSRVAVRDPRMILVLTCVTCLLAVAVAQGIDLLVGRTHAAGAGATATVIVNVAASFVFVLGAARLYWRRRPASAGNCLLAGTALLLAAARFQVVATSLVPGAWITPREFLRLGAYGFLLAAVLTEYRWRRRADDHASVAAEREELVRDLHDGLVQDLAAVAMHSEQLEPRGDEDPAVLGDAARRALAASRRTIIDLSASTAPNTVTSLNRVARELEARLGTEIAVRADADPNGCPAFDLGRGAHQRFVKIASDVIIQAASQREVGRVDLIIRSCGTRWRLTVRSDAGRRARFRPSSVALHQRPFLARGTGRDSAPERYDELNAGRDPAGATVSEPACPAPAHH